MKKNKIIHLNLDEHINRKLVEKSEEFSIPCSTLARLIIKNVLEDDAYQLEFSLLKKKVG